MLKIRRKIMRKYKLLLDAGKFCVLVFSLCLFFLIIPASMFAGKLTKEVLFECVELSMVLTGIILILLAIVNIVCEFLGKFAGESVLYREYDTNKITSGILICSVLGRQALVPLVASNVCFIFFFAMNGGLNKERFGELLLATIIATGAALIMFGAIGIFTQIIKKAFYWIKTHKISLQIEEVKEI